MQAVKCALCPCRDLDGFTFKLLLTKEAANVWLVCMLAMFQGCSCAFIQDMTVESIHEFSND
eukprot:6212226-Pleurochrysis_carterae.AAC.3